MFYRAKRVDRTQKAIAAALVATGWSVTLLHAVGGGCPDILAGKWGQTYLFEVKTPEEAARLERGTSHNKATAARQKTWKDGWRGGPVIQVASVEQAMQATGSAGGKPAPTGVERFGPQQQ